MARKTKLYSTKKPHQKQKLVIDSNKANLAKEYTIAGFKTGKYMTEKDRPRKKKWSADDDC